MPGMSGALTGDPATGNVVQECRYRGFLYMPVSPGVARLAQTQPKLPSLSLRAIHLVHVCLPPKIGLRVAGYGGLKIGIWYPGYPQLKRYGSNQTSKTRPTTHSHAPSEPDLVVQHLMPATTRI